MKNSSDITPTLSQGETHKSPWTFENGLTVKELKTLIADWPEQHPDGTPTRVLIWDENANAHLITETCPTNWAEPLRTTADIALLFNIKSKG